MVLTLLDLKETIFTRFHMGLNMIIEGKYCTTHRLAVKNLAGTLYIHFNFGLELCLYI